MREIGTYEHGSEKDSGDRMTQDDKRFLKSIHIVPDRAPVGKRTRETSAPFEEIGKGPGAESIETARAMIDRLFTMPPTTQPSTPAPTPTPEPIPVISDAHPFSVTLDYSEWVTVVAAIQSAADQLQQARLRKLPTVETIELEVRLRMAERKITEASRTAK